MSQPTLLAVIALVASLVLTFQHRPLPFPIVALVVSGIEVLQAFGLLHMSLGRIPLAVVLGIALVVAGVGVYIKTGAKTVVAAATTVTLIGLFQTITSLHLRF